MSTGGIEHGQLKAFFERIERLEEEKKAIAEDIRDVFAEAKGTGFDVKIMREILKLRKMDDGDRSERESMMDLYMSELGMLPLFEGAGE